MQHVGVQLLVTTSCEVCLALRGSLPCFSLIRLSSRYFAFTMLAGLFEGLRGKQSLGFFHAAVPTCAA